MEILFENQTIDGESNVIDNIQEGYRMLKASGVFDGAVIQIEIDFKDNDFVPLVAGASIQTITIPGVNTVVFLRTGVRLKSVLSGAGVSTDVTLKML